MRFKQIDIDPCGGFCGGVIRAVGKAEAYLQAHPQEHLYSLGDIVHNEFELDRLGRLGLRTVSEESLPADFSTILIRAHGVAPDTYKLLRERNLRIIDCTCPVVLGIQRRIAEAPSDVVIYGKRGHPEVTGLLGNARGRAFVVENEAQARALSDAEALPEKGAKGPLKEDATLFSQTTMSPEGYEKIIAALSEKFPSLKVNRTICREVQQRFSRLERFAREHDVIVFVAGSSSSNGRVLSELARSANPRTFITGDAGSVDKSWFRDGDSVGVSGATSTPLTLLEQVRKRIASFTEA